MLDFFDGSLASDMPLDWGRNKTAAMVSSQTWPIGELMNRIEHKFQNRKCLKKLNNRFSNSGVRIHNPDPLRSQVWIYEY